MINEENFNEVIKSLEPKARMELYRDFEKREDVSDGVKAELRKIKLSNVKKGLYESRMYFKYKGWKK